MDEIYHVEQLLAGFMIRYPKLSELISYSYYGSQCTEVNLYIDLHSALKALYSGDIWTYKSSGKFEIAAGIINMCAHYRYFFRYLGVSTNIYLIYGLNCPDANMTFVENYNSRFLTSYIKKPDITKEIESNLSVVGLIAQYLPNIYFFNIGNCEVSSMIDYLLSNVVYDNPVENIIISKDVLSLQLVPAFNARILRPLKSSNGDESFIIDQSNLWNNYTVNFRKCAPPKLQISNTFFQNVLCMTSVAERGMWSVFNINKAMQIFDTATKNGFLDPSQLYTQSSINTILAMMDIPHNPADLDMRFKAINTHYQSTFILPMEKPEFKRLRLINLEDVQSLKDIVAKYFDKNPIDLDRL